MRGKSPTAMEAVTQLTICRTWEEMLSQFVKYSDELKTADAEKAIEELLGIFKSDAYSCSLIKERQKFVALHRKSGIREVLQHKAEALKEPTDMMRLMAKMTRSDADSNELAMDLLQNLPRILRGGSNR